MTERLTSFEWNRHKVTYILINQFEFSGIRKPPHTLTIGCYGKGIAQGGAEQYNFEQMSEVIDKFVYQNLIGKVLNIEGSNLEWTGTYRISKFICDNGFLPTSFNVPFNLFRAHAEGHNRNPLSL